MMAEADFIRHARATRGRKPWSAIPRSGRRGRTILAVPPGGRRWNRFVWYAV